MQDQAHHICDPSTKPEELHHLGEVFQANGFPQHLWQRRPPPRQSSPPTEDSQPEEPQKTLWTPYVWGLGEKLEKSLAPVSIRLIFTPARTLKWTLMKVKAQLPEDRRRWVVYQVSCNNCDHVYTEES